MEYGRVAPEELGEVVRLLTDCGLPADDVDQSLLLYFIGARSHGLLIGVVGLEPLDHVALLRSLAVAPAQRGLGVGARLCDEVESLARAHNIADLYLLTTTAADWFAVRGYDRLDRSTLPASVRDTTQFRKLCPASAVALHKRLASPGS